jgi:hypothetical protein
MQRATRKSDYGTDCKSAPTWADQQATWNMQRATRKPDYGTDCNRGTRMREELGEAKSAPTWAEFTQKNTFLARPEPCNDIRQNI